MYSYNIDEEKVNKKAKAVLEEKTPQGEDELKQILNGIDKDKGYVQGEVGGYEEKDFDLEKMEQSEFNEGDAKKEAEDLYAGALAKDKTEVENKTEENKQKLEGSKNSLSESVNKNKAELEEIFGNRKEDAERDAVKRGLSRSSIIINKIEAFDKGFIDEVNRLNDGYKNDLSKIEGELSVLESQKQNALKNFDLTYAIKINEKIDALKTQHIKKQDEILKYNNTIAEKEAKFKEQQEKNSKAHDEAILKKKEEYLSAVKKYGKEVVDAPLYEAKYPVVRSYLKNMPKEEAIKQMVSSTFFREQLGTTNFAKLFTEINRS